MKLKFFLALILVVLLGGCSTLSQDGKEAPFLADASRCDVANPLSKERTNRRTKRQKIDAEVAQAAQEQVVSQDTRNSFRAKSAAAIYRHAAKPNAAPSAAAAEADTAAAKYEKFAKRTEPEQAT